METSVPPFSAVPRRNSPRSVESCSRSRHRRRARGRTRHCRWRRSSGHERLLPSQIGSQNGRRRRSRHGFSTDWPAFNLPCRNNPCHVVRPANGIAAACEWSISGGLPAIAFWSRTTFSHISRRQYRPPRKPRHPLYLAPPARTERGGPEFDKRMARA